MDVRIGVTQTPKEIEVELPSSADRAQVVKDIEASLANGEGVLWLTDRRGRTVGVPSAKVAYVEIGSSNDERRVGFGVG
ncbi:MAG: Putative ATP-binding protein [uncultured Acidimicrobiales bacterium]|uniref:ATP-binding protein n=1 Tax=uncultured Acidimicrobiales bacterium TaxID=310071 RepID=A0A6J4GYX9_9ACTN|nr:MAG: Putative ATP-binding protein [uncultured Acidimicrobiales bacterium]